MTAVSIAKTIHDVLGAAAAVSAGLDRGVDVVSPALQLVAGFFPGAASVLAAVQLAAPYIQTIAKYAPAARDAIEAGEPIFEAIDKASPDLLKSVKGLYAVMANGEPSRRGDAKLTADDVRDGTAIAFAGPLIMGRQWTADEMRRWWDNASSPSST